MSQFERNIKYLVKHRVIYRSNPVNDKPTEKHSWGWYFEKIGRASCRERV